MDRRVFLGTAPALLLVALPAIARKTSKKGAKDTISPPEDLMREHGVLDHVLLIYEAGIRCLASGEDFDPAVFTQSAEIVCNFIHDYHKKSEEEHVFPRFRSAGRMVDLVDVLRAQHTAGPRLTERILKAAPEMRAPAGTSFVSRLSHACETPPMLMASAFFMIVSLFHPPPLGPEPSL